MSLESKHSVFEDNTKLKLLEKHGDVNLDEKFQEFELLGDEANKSDLLWDRIVVRSGYTPKFTKKRHMVIMLAAFASVGGMLSGVDQSLISGAKVSLVPDLSLTDPEFSLVSALMPLGAVAGCFGLSPLNEYWGRRISIMCACVSYTLGGILCAATPNVEGLYAGRFFIGFGIGLESIIPAYVSECTPTEIRGNLVSLYQFNIALGEVFGFAIAAMFYTLDGAWRYILGSSLFFSTILLVGMFFLPESPRYLVHKDKVGAAYNIWSRLRDMDDMQNKVEFLDMIQSLELEKLDDIHASSKHKWLDFITVPRARRSLVYANIMIFLGQFTGCNAVMYYMSTLMRSIGFNEKNSVFMSLVGGGSLLLGTIPAILFMDYCGRRFWANSMLPGFFIGLVFIGIGYHFPLTSSTSMGLYMTGLIMYESFFGSYACLTWVIPSEVYPTYLRSYGMTVTSAGLYLWAFIITYNFSDMWNAFTSTGLTLGFYGGIAVVGWVYQILFVVETKGRSLEEIDELFSMPTSKLIRSNLSATMHDFRNIFRGRFKEVIRGVPPQ
ncbi:hypothetical protein KL906_003554 [Ogataea polymorpha]|uniref:Major facilitator superfamily (MFS) profile domain-containing protein n=1 Tax=Ogataea polymorpha TaxID=460523 RepID=A0A9P8NSX7_9ASCO|nr:hypothetical protein KL906_003554 [Ogataea polymorpha]KAG7916720.1 hypothetical protein KL927_003359 [Ogataea polymorpha]KAH3659072.1 hypothetical protein OGATHE_006798 [Ogataea polymorpha]